MNTNAYHKVSKYIELLQNEGIVKEISPNAQNLLFNNLCYNSNEITKDTLFICKGARFKEEYILGKENDGLICYISEKKYNLKSEYIIVTDEKKALAIAAQEYFNYDSQAPEICALVGTKGKTTTVYFLKSILNASQRKYAYSTTVEMNDGEKTKASNLTTPESFDLHELISRAKANNCKNMIMEVSSMAYKMKRTYNMTFAFTAFTNISPDHISANEHPDFDDYLSCKIGILNQGKTAIINIDDEHSSEILKRIQPTTKVITYSLKNTSADIYMKALTQTENGKLITIHTNEETFDILMHLPGDYNILNALCAVSCAYAMGIDIASIQKGFEEVNVPGRMEKISKNGYIAICDYAHNKVSMNLAMEALSSAYPQKKIKCIFGCSYKVKQRREDMAYESSRKCDYVYITSDNPGFENAQTIAEEIQSFLTEYGCKSEIVLDRKEAIRKAINEMQKDDIVFIAGKGHEAYQIINGVYTEYEGDAKIAREAMEMYK